MAAKTSPKSTGAMAAKSAADDIKGTGGVPRDVGATRAPETPTRRPAESPKNNDVAKQRDRSNDMGHTTEAKANRRIQEDMGAMRAPRGANKGSTGANRVLPRKILPATTTATDVPASTEGAWLRNMQLISGPYLWGLQPSRAYHRVCPNPHMLFSP